MCSPPGSLSTPPPSNPTPATLKRTEGQPGRAVYCEQWSVDNLRVLSHIIPVSSPLTPSKVPDMDGVFHGYSINFSQNSKR